MAILVGVASSTLSKESRRATTIFRYICFSVAVYTASPNWLSGYSASILLLAVGATHAFRGFIPEPVLFASWAFGSSMVLNVLYIVSNSWFATWHIYIHTTVWIITLLFIYLQHRNSVNETPTKLTLYYGVCITLYLFGFYAIDTLMYLLVPLIFFSYVIGYIRSKPYHRVDKLYTPDPNVPGGHKVAMVTTLVHTHFFYFLIGFILHLLGGGPVAYLPWMAYSTPANVEIRPPVGSSHIDDHPVQDKPTGNVIATPTTSPSLPLDRQFYGKRRAPIKFETREDAEHFYNELGSNQSMCAGSYPIATGFSGIVVFFNQNPHTVNNPKDHIIGHGTYCGQAFVCTRHQIDSNGTYSENAVLEWCYVAWLDDFLGSKDFKVVHPIIYRSFEYDDICCFTVSDPDFTNGREAMSISTKPPDNTDGHVVTVFFDPSAARTHYIGYGRIHRDSSHFCSTNAGSSGSPIRHPSSSIIYGVHKSGGVGVNHFVPLMEQHKDVLCNPSKYGAVASRKKIATIPHLESTVADDALAKSYATQLVQHYQQFKVTIPFVTALHLARQFLKRSKLERPPFASFKLYVISQTAKKNEGRKGATFTGDFELSQKYGANWDDTLDYEDPDDWREFYDAPTGGSEDYLLDPELAQERNREAYRQLTGKTDKQIRAYYKELKGKVRKGKNSWADDVDLLHLNELGYYSDETVHRHDFNDRLPEVPLIPPKSSRLSAAIIDKPSKHIQGEGKDSLQSKIVKADLESAQDESVKPLKSKAKKVKIQDNSPSSNVEPTSVHPNLPAQVSVPATTLDPNLHFMREFTLLITQLMNAKAVPEATVMNNPKDLKSKSRKSSKRKSPGKLTCKNCKNKVFFPKNSQKSFCQKCGTEHTRPENSGTQ